jgi:hypothetical protein
MASPVTLESFLLPGAASATSSSGPATARKTVKRTVKNSAFNATQMIAFVRWVEDNRAVIETDAEKSYDYWALRFSTASGIPCSRQQMDKYLKAAGVKKPNAPTLNQGMLVRLAADVERLNLQIEKIQIAINNSALISK